MGRFLRAATAAALAAVLCVACGSGGERAPLPSNLTTELATFVVTIFETDSVAASALSADSHRPLVCVAEPFGIDPDTATEPGGVGTVYAAVFCAVRDLGVPYEGSSRISSVVAVHRASPVTVQVPRDGTYHQQDIEQIFPKGLRERAFEGYRDTYAADLELAGRYADQSR